MPEGGTGDEAVIRFLHDLAYSALIRKLIDYHAVPREVVIEVARITSECHWRVEYLIALRHHIESLLGRVIPQSTECLVGGVVRRAKSDAFETDGFPQDDRACELLLTLVFGCQEAKSGIYSFGDLYRYCVDNVELRRVIYNLETQEE